MADIEKTEEQLDRERKAVASLHGAKSNMTQVLDRVQTLEAHLARAKRALMTAKTHIGQSSHIAATETQRGRPVHQFIEEEIGVIAVVLG